jgi:hypothetical protein
LTKSRYSASAPKIDAFWRPSSSIPSVLKRLIFCMSYAVSPANTTTSAYVVIQYSVDYAKKKLTTVARSSPISAMKRITPSLVRSTLVVHPITAIAPNIPAVTKNAVKTDSVV